MTNIILFGPPGAGKGTQSKKLIEKYSLSHLATGDLFRWNMAQKTPIGEKIKEIVDSGSLVSDDITIAMIEDTMKEKRPTIKGFLFDGFPRTLDQAISLDRLLTKHEMTIDFAIVLQVAEAVLYDRIAKRKNAENRTDDDDAKLSKRIEIFFNTTMQAFPLYAKQEKLSYVDGVGDMDEVFNKICDVIEGNKA